MIHWKNRRRFPAALEAVFTAVFLAPLFLACGNAPGINPGEIYQNWETAPQPFSLADYKNKSIEEELPEWVFWYIYNGIRGIETMPQYQDRYIFVEEASGINKNALNQWMESYRTIQNFSRLVSSRVQARFINASGGDVDGTYGRYFEQVIREVSDTMYPEVWKDDDYWILKQYIMEETDEAIRDEYNFLILMSIDRRVLEERILRILYEQRNQGKRAREQNAAISRLIENFFSGGVF